MNPIVKILLALCLSASVVQTKGQVPADPLQEDGAGSSDVSMEKAYIHFFLAFRPCVDAISASGPS
jgi:hypothetical protein